MKSLYANAVKQLENITSLLKSEYSDKRVFNKAITKIKKPQKIHQKKLKLKLDNGKVASFSAFRSQHNDARGPFKGGIRFHQDVTEDEVKALSFWMSVKCAVVNIPYGGGKGGITVNPKNLSLNELQNLSRKYAEFLTPYIGPWKDIPAPDVNTGEREMAWMLDAYEKKIGKHAPAAFTGKPLELGGSLGRIEATGLGGFYVLEALSKRIKMVPKKMSIAIQGFGNVGYWFSYFAWKAGYKIKAISDSSGGFVSQRGLNIDELSNAKKKHGSFKNATKDMTYEFITNDELLSQKVDLLTPAALENAIDKTNARNVNAKYIIELANGPTTPNAEAVLTQKGVSVIPDVLANAGGVSVSYFEWAQNLNRYQWTKQKVFNELKNIMNTSLDDVFDVKVKIKNISYRQAAYYIGIRRIIDAMISRGLV